MRGFSLFVNVYDIVLNQVCYPFIKTDLKLRDCDVRLCIIESIFFNAQIAKIVICH